MVAGLPAKNVNPLAHKHSFRHVVSHEECRPAFLFPQSQRGFAELLSEYFVEGRKRFVHQHISRRRDKSSRQRRTHLHSTAELGGKFPHISLLKSD